jgi:hypothetical protein
MYKKRISCMFITLGIALQALANVGERIRVQPTESPQVQTYADVDTLEIEVKGNYKGPSEFYHFGESRLCGVRYKQKTHAGYTISIDMRNIPAHYTICLYDNGIVGGVADSVHPLRCRSLPKDYTVTLIRAPRWKVWRSGSTAVIVDNRSAVAAPPEESLPLDEKKERA